MKFLYTLRNKNYFINKNKTLEKFQRQYKYVMQINFISITIKSLKFLILYVDFH